METRKVIVYYGNTCYPDKDASAHRTLGNAKALRELGYKVIMVGCRSEERRCLLETKEEFDGFDIYYYEEPKTLSQWAAYLFGFEPLKDVLGRVDASSVILYNHPSVSTQRVLSYCHKKGVKVYADCTEWFDPKGSSVHSVIKRVDTWYRMRHVNRMLDGIIAISSYLQNYYQKKGCETICVPPLVDLESKKWAMDNDDDSISQAQTSLIYVGNPGAGAKDKLDIIISALEHIRITHSNLRFHLNVIGMSDVQFKDAFRTDVRDCDFVSFLGRKPNAEALEMIKKSDFSVFLRDANLVCTAGFPTKFSESIACGTPVLTNITSDLGLYMNEGKNGFIIDTSSFKTMCNSLYRAISVSSETIKEMKEYCKSDKSFDYHSFKDEFKKMF